MSKKIAYPIFAVLMFALILSACGGAPAAAAPAENLAPVVATQAPVATEPPAATVAPVLENMEVAPEQTIPDDEIVGMVYYNTKTGEVLAPDRFMMPTGWDGVKPPEPIIAGSDKLGIGEDQTHIYCEADQKETKGDWLAFRCGVGVG